MTESSRTQAMADCFKVSKLQGKVVDRPKGQEIIPKQRNSDCASSLSKRTSS
jgi:hypothetical protein